MPSAIIPTGTAFSSSFRSPASLEHKATQWEMHYILIWFLSPVLNRTTSFKSPKLRCLSYEETLSWCVLETLSFKMEFCHQNSGLPRCRLVTFNFNSCLFNQVLPTESLQKNPWTAELKGIWVAIHVEVLREGQPKEAMKTWFPTPHTTPDISFIKLFLNW